jgi:lipoate-protein ligase A
MTIWRLIPPLQASGQFQMGLDAWLLDQHRQGLHPPTLRFYTWEPAAISLGYHQRQIPSHWHSLSWHATPLDLVQRPTGGRAVLHQGDLTYAIVTSGLAGNRKQVYQKLCEFLVLGWRSLGVELHYGQSGRGYIHNPNCFGTATDADLVLSDGSKLIGSAQLYRGNAILQHGSMRLEQDADLFRQVFGVEPMLPQLPLISKTETAVKTVTEALIQAAAHCFAAEFQVQPLSDAEWKAIHTQPALELLK